VSLSKWRTEKYCVRRIDSAWIRQFIGFAGVGAIGTAGHYAVLIGLVQLAGVSPVMASIAGFIAGAVINYFLSYRYIFQSRKRHAEALTKFLLVASAGLGLNAAIVWFGVSMLEWHYLVSQVIATGIILLWNFTANRLWTFSHRRAIHR
jgi:putative flippase GtrA